MRRTLFLCGLAVLGLVQANARPHASQTPLLCVAPSNDRPESGEHDVIVRPFPIHLVNPKFPLKTKKKNAQGEIVLHATIAIDGSVKDISVISGDPALVDIAVEAVRQWRYLPSIRNGEFIEVPQDITLKYDWGKGASQPEDPESNGPTSPPEDVVKELAAGELFRFGQGVTPPRAVYAPDPEYAETARKEQFQGKEWRTSPNAYQG
jgi:TonB family protein